MQKPPGIDRRHFVGAAVATAAANTLSFPITVLAEGSTSMNAAVQPSDDKTPVRPYHVNFPESDLTELRRRIKATRWPDRETVSDAMQGVQLETTQALAL